MTYVFHRDPRFAYPLAVRGEGCYLIDAAGKRYLDGCGGAAVSCLGHSDREVIDAVKAQVERLAFAHTSFFSSAPMEALAEELVRVAPSSLSHAYFVSSGSEAVEASLKLARQYFLEIGQPSRSRVIARRQGYHGNTLGALAAGGNVARRRPFAPLLVEMSHVSPCYPYRERDQGESEEAYGDRLAAELRAEIERLGPETVAAFVAETVSGATLGAVPPVPGYFRKIREVCDRYGVLLILDEVMCGVGRTGTFFAFEAEGVVPDLITIGKGLGAGYQPIAALLVGDRIYDAIVSGSGFFQHGHTYSGHALGCAAGHAVLKRFRQGKLLEAVDTAGAALEARLREQFGAHPHVGDIRGRGLFWGLELVKDRARKTPFDPKFRLHSVIKRLAQEAGLLCYPMGGTVDGAAGDHILLAPPFIISGPEIDALVELLGAAVDLAIAGTGAAGTGAARTGAARTGAARTGAAG